MMRGFPWAPIRDADMRNLESVKGPLFETRTGKYNPTSVTEELIEGSPTRIEEATLIPLYMRRMDVPRAAIIKTAIKILIAFSSEERLIKNQYNIHPSNLKT